MQYLAGSFTRRPTANRPAFEGDKTNHLRVFSANARRVTPLQRYGTSLAAMRRPGGHCVGHDAKHVSWF